MASKAFDGVTAHQLAARNGIPNHPHWPLLIYSGAVEIIGTDSASVFEALFTRNGWPAAWRNGVYGFHHFHSNAHEVLGIYSGEVTIQAGGEEGPILTAHAGDVLVLPAGTGHRKLSSSADLGVVGAYPVGQDPDMCTASTTDPERHSHSILRVPRPPADPVHGPHGPLLSLWGRTKTTL